MTTASAIQTLRAATREIHARLEATPFAKTILDETLPLDAYAGYIRVLAVIHTALEGRLDSCDHSLVSRVWSEDLRRLPELLADNDVFRWKLIPEAPKASQAALRAASHIQLASKNNPMTLLGCLYVLGGSSKGAVILAPLAAQALRLTPERGLSYLTRHSITGPAEWERAASVLDEVATDAVQIQSMVESALVIFQCLVEAFEALWPLDRAEMRYMVTALNPEAGIHPVPQDDRDLTAVLRASERSLAEFPYFLYRYGKRGRRFTDSDGAWLATLSELGSEAMRAQVNWLGQVLSARGMPCMLLARHLKILAEELLAARPNQVERSSLLEDAAKRILNDLDARLPRALLQKHVKNLQLACGRTEDFACAEAISLMASAATDEANGLEGSTKNLMSWLADPTRFSQTWVDAVTDSLAAMRKELSEQPIG